MEGGQRWEGAVVGGAVDTTPVAMRMRECAWQIVHILQVGRSMMRYDCCFFGSDSYRLSAQSTVLEHPVRATIATLTSQLLVFCLKPSYSLGQSFFTIRSSYLSIVSISLLISGLSKISLRSHLLLLSSYGHPHSRCSARLDFSDPLQSLHSVQRQ